MKSSDLQCKNSIGFAQFSLSEPGEQLILSEKLSIDQAVLEEAPLPGDKKKSARSNKGTGKNMLIAVPKLL